MIKRITSKRVSGTISEFIIVILGVIAISLIAIYGVSVFSDLDTKNKLDLICRQAILRLESDGNLNPLEESAEEQRIREEIINTFGNRVNASTIQVNVIPNTYGNEVSIEVTCELKLKSKRFGDGFKIKNISEVQYTTYSRQYSSTSKT